ncbi:methyltransferase domain-containing protein [uncultured Thiohalocapsa sp.]|uniref:methyltransferase domain-containing protein n=1 Tax=uncultured Thiohalocapsa sp. TaxID=768990 RepID=UPI0025FB0D43|nr:methyltransferase domain-containing protein [uncultured Thiohalocapsa sp.]
MMAAHYIHGFSDAERRRLIAQAQMLAAPVFGGLDFSGDHSLLEVGCAVGAELHLIAQRAPHLALTGVDLSALHLRAGQAWLAGHAQIRLLQADARALPFPDDSFDVGMTIWLLEHLADPAAVVRELLRVVKPGGRVILTEVDNHSFGFDPPQPAISAWWDAFNACQAEVGGGDPYIGRRLRSIATCLGAEVLAEEPRLVISSADATRHRTEQLHYLRALLASGAERMLAAGYATAAMQQAMAAAFDAVQAAPGVAFRYGAVRLICRKPRP